MDPKQEKETLEAIEEIRFHVKLMAFGLVTLTAIVGLYSFIKLVIAAAAN